MDKEHKQRLAEQSKNRQNNLTPAVQNQFLSVIEENKIKYEEEYTPEQIERTKLLLIHCIDNFKKKTILIKLTREETERIVLKAFSATKYNVKDYYAINAVIDDFKKYGKKHRTRKDRVSTKKSNKRKRNRGHRKGKRKDSDKQWGEIKFS